MLQFDESRKAWRAQVWNFHPAVVSNLRVFWECRRGPKGSHGQGGGPMGKAAKTGRKRPGLTRRMIRSTLRVGMLATAVLVGRKTAGGGRARDGQATRSGGSAASQGPGAAAGGQPPPEHTTSPAATGDGGRTADSPQQIPPKGWKAIAK